MDVFKHFRFLAIILFILLNTSCASISCFTGNHTMTDKDITTNVQARIACDKGLADLNINVSTFERIVTLEGDVENITQREVAICLAKSVPGVCSVISKLFIKPYNP